MKYADEPMKFIDNEVDLMSLVRGLAQVRDEAWVQNGFRQAPKAVVAVLDGCGWTASSEAWHRCGMRQR
jgi:hypothetical protein